MVVYYRSEFGYYINVDFTVRKFVNYV